MSDKPASREQIAAAAALAGIELPPEYFDELVDSYRRIEPVLKRMRQARAHGNEPAHAYDPRKFMPDAGST